MMKLYSTKVQTQNDFFQHSYSEEINSYFFHFEFLKKYYLILLDPTPPQAELLIDRFCPSNSAQLPILAGSPIQGGQQKWQKWPLTAYRTGKALQNLLVKHTGGSCAWAFHLQLPLSTQQSLFNSKLLFVMFLHSSD
jgi:hypothetical protein